MKGASTIFAALFVVWNAVPAHALEFRWFEDERLPMIDLLVSLPFGTATEPAGASGLLEAWLEWQRQRTGADFDPAPLGARWNHSVDLHAIHFGTHGLAGSAEAQLRLLHRIAVLTPIPSAQEWAEFLPRWKLAVRSHQPTISDYSGRLFQSLVAAGTPYARGTMFLESEATRLSWKALKQWLNSYWYPNSARVTLAGRVAALRASHQAETLFQSWKSEEPVSTKFTETVAPAPLVGTRNVLIVGDAHASANLRVGVRSLDLGNSETPCLELAAALFAGSYQSRLSRRLRDTLPLVFSAEGGFWFEPHFGAWSFSVSAGRAELPQLLNLVEEEWNNWLAADTLPDPAELEQARTRLLGGLPLLTMTLESQISRELTNWRFGLPAALWTDRAAALRSATPEKLAKTLHKWWKPNQAVWVLSGSRQTIEPALAGRAPWSKVRRWTWPDAERLIQKSAAASELSKTNTKPVSVP